MFAKIKNELLGYSVKERLFVLFAMLCGFFITAEYAVVKPISHSLFIATYGAKLFPLVWLIAIPVNFFVVSLYNRFVFKLGCFRTLLFSTIFSIFVFSFSALFLAKIVWLPFLLYIFKDIYIMLLFQQLWSVIHATFPQNRAKYLYGIFFGVGGIGAALASLIPGFLSVRYGSEKLLFIAPAFAVLLTICYGIALRMRGNFTPSDHKDSGGGLGLIKRSKTLQVILILVVCMQVSATLLEFQFHQNLQLQIPLQDLRTAYLGKLFSVVHTINTFLQFAGSYLVVHFIGLRRAHLMIPTILGLGSISYLFSPNFALLSYNYGMIKSFDYSLFTILKEMLYVPLKVEEKFKAKAFIDVFAYRSSKAFASFILLLVPSGMILSCSLVGIFLFWLLVISRGLTSRKSATTMSEYVQ
ncbi:MAG: Npt1/Npt2 family nucleotide transporter [Candidatus Algichlamydia australiensis]|nr:Npt1/Npt2 family nucleotide transporter [Chlamydiales bacterium]